MDPPDGLLSRWHGKEDNDCPVLRELADRVEVVARGRGISVNALVVEALLAEVETVKQDDHFMATLRKVTQHDKEILDRLAQ